MSRTLTALVFMILAGPRAQAERLTKCPDNMKVRDDECIAKVENHDEELSGQELSIALSATKAIDLATPRAASPSPRPKSLRMAAPTTATGLESTAAEPQSRDVSPQVLQLKALPVVDEVLEAADKLITVGKGLQQFYSANAASSEIKNAVSAAAIPAAAEHNWKVLTDCKLPKGHKVTKVLKNMFGITKAELTYLVTYTYGCSYQGKGHYLKDVKVVPSKVYVSWATQLTSEVTVSEASNMGSEDDPTPMITLTVVSKANAQSVEDIGSVVTVTGKGEVAEITGDQ